MIGRQKGKQADAKRVDRVERRAANRQGITYASRGAGRASEHFEVGHGAHATHNSRKTNRKHDRGKTNEQRIVSG
jgi:hypothetical protein